ncbi:hypothetical protein LB536_29315 [Mesorhizobium sp. ES1-3]|nr:hypothetical protein [Mesorhizobium sp. ES1-3]
MWQFDLLVPGDRRDFPFVGIAISWQFVVAFVAGCALICAFAWKRFSEPTYDVNAAAFRDFKDLTVWNLKDSVSLRRAYAIYCVSLIFIYAMMAFFGRVIVQLFDKLSISGLQIGMGTIEFDSWRWPLFLALGISGFAPLINPLVPAENWLRRFSHEVVGIPTRLREKADRLKTLIDGPPSEDAERATSNWVRAALGPKLSGCLVLEKNLNTVVQWSYKEHVEWSDPEIRRKLIEYERNVRDDTEAALADFEYLTDPINTPDSLMVKGQGRLKEFEKRLLGNTRLLEEARDKFSLIMAIYCEYGSRFDKMRAGRLKKSIIEKFVDRHELPATGLPLYWFLIIFIVYFLFIKAQWHPLISSVPLSNQATATTAALETLKVFLLVWLPMTGVAAFVDVVDGPPPEDPSINDSVTWATISGALAAFAIAAVGMMALAVLYSALPASNINQMRQSLFGSGDWTGALTYYLLMAPVAVFCFCFVNGVRSVDKTPGLWTIVGLALAITIITAVYLAAVVTLTSSSPCTPSIAPLVEVPVWRILFLKEYLETCFAFYGALDLIVIPLSVLISVLGLAKLRSKRTRGNGDSPGTTSTLLAVACAAGLLGEVAVSPTHAKEIVVGFRTDIPPFSYLAPPQQGTKERPYLGYLADLCYEIFDNSGYEVIQVPVTGDNRFAAMRRPAGIDGSRVSTNGQAIDVLCDATTVRLDDPKRMEAGVFSPIVFVSGVSYLWRSDRQFRDVEIGYLDNSTAVRVAKEACSVDALRLGSLGKPPVCREALESDCLFERREPPKEPTKSLRDRAASVPSYVLCPKSDHTDLIRWFCSDTYRDKVYFADREIILGQLAAWKAAGRRCDYVRDPLQSFTYEPYALLISKADMVLFAFVQRRIYELFSHRAGAAALFYKWFPEQTMSEPLAWLFSLNGVMEQDELLSGKKEFPAIVVRSHVQ